MLRQARQELAEAQSAYGRARGRDHYDAGQRLDRAKHEVHDLTDMRDLARQNVERLQQTSSAPDCIDSPSTQKAANTAPTNSPALTTVFQVCYKGPGLNQLVCAGGNETPFCEDGTRESAFASDGSCKPWMSTSQSLVCTVPDWSTRVSAQSHNCVPADCRAPIGDEKGEQCTPLAPPSAATFKAKVLNPENPRQPLQPVHPDLLPPPVLPPPPHRTVSVPSWSPSISHQPAPVPTAPQVHLLPSPALPPPAPSTMRAPGCIGNIPSTIGRNPTVTTPSAVTMLPPPVLPPAAKSSVQPTVAPSSFSNPTVTAAPPVTSTPSHQTPATMANPTHTPWPNNPANVSTAHNQLKLNTTPRFEPQTHTNLSVTAAPPPKHEQARNRVNLYTPANKTVNSTSSTRRVYSAPSSSSHVSSTYRSSSAVHVSQRSSRRR
jgi:hypothetical protein